MPESTTAVERYSEPRGGAVALSDRDMRSIEFQSQAIAYLDPRLKDMKPDEKKQAAVGLAITLYNYGLPITVTNAKKLHLIQGEPVESAQLLIGLLEMAGHEVRPVVISEERCVLRGWRHGKGEPYEMTYTLEQARTSGALDEWVEKWSKNDRGGWKLDSRLVIRTDGEQVNTPWPDWVSKQIADGRVKRKDAWFLYRSDMLTNRCIRRLAKWMGADALLGAGSPIDELAEDDEQRFDPPAPRSAVDGDHHDDDITDAEIVDEPPASGSPAFPDSPNAGNGPATASAEWVTAFLTKCQEVNVDGVRPGALAAAIVRHVTDGERSEPSTLRRGAEQAAAKAALVDVDEGRWEVGVGHDGMATLVEAAPREGEQ